MVNAAAAVPRNSRRLEWLDICLPGRGSGGGGTVAIITGIQGSVQGATVERSDCRSREERGGGGPRGPGGPPHPKGPSARTLLPGGGEAEGHEAEGTGGVADP